MNFKDCYMLRITNFWETKRNNSISSFRAHSKEEVSSYLKNLPVSFLNSILSDILKIKINLKIGTPDRIYIKLKDETNICQNNPLLSCTWKSINLETTNGQLIVDKLSLEIMYVATLTFNQISYNGQSIRVEIGKIIYTNDVWEFRPIKDIPAT